MIVTVIGWYWELHDVIAGAACVLSSRLQPALLPMASGVPVLAVE